MDNPVVQQLDWRWFADTAADPSTGDALAAENTKPTLTSAQMQNVVVRLRVLLTETAGDPGAAAALKLQLSGDGTNWSDLVLHGGAGEGEAHHQIGDGAATNGNTIAATRLVNANTAGKYHEDQVGTEAIAANESGQEIDFAVRCHWPIPDHDYRFRLVWGGTVVALGGGASEIQLRTSTVNDRPDTLVKLDNTTASGEPEILRFGLGNRMFYDGANWWAFYNLEASQSTTMRYKNWSGSGNWSSESTITFTNISGQNDFDVIFRDIGGTKYVWLCVADTATQYYMKRGTISGTTITWDGTERTITAPAANADSSHRVSLSIDDGDFLWLGGITTTNNIWAARTTNTGDNADYYSFNTTKTQAESGTLTGVSDRFEIYGLASDLAILVFYEITGEDLKSAEVSDASGFSSSIALSATAAAHDNDWDLGRTDGSLYCVHGNSQDNGYDWVLRVYNESTSTWANGTDPSVDKISDATSNDGIRVVPANDGNIYAFGTFHGTIDETDRVIKYKKYTGGTSGTWDGSLTQVEPTDDRLNGDSIGSTRDGAGDKILVMMEVGDDGLVGTEWCMDWFAIDAAAAAGASSLFRQRQAVRGAV